MKFKGTIGMVVLLATVVLYYLYVEIPTEEKQQQEKELAEKVWLFETGDVDQFSLIRKDQTLTLKRDGDLQWKVASPLAVPGDARNAEDLLFTLQSAIFSRVVEERSDDLSAYGLKEPNLKISLQLKDGTRQTLWVGDSAPIGRAVYGKRENSDRVLLISQRREELDKRLYDLRDKSIFKFAPKEVGRIEIKSSDGALRFSKAKEVWTVSGNNAARGDSNEISNLIHRIKSAQAKSFLDEDPKDLAAFGLDAPFLELTLEAGEKKETETLLIGRKGENKFYLAKLVGAKNVFTVDQVLIDLLSKDALDFMDKNLLAFDQNEVAELVLTNAAETIQIKKNTDGADWEILKPAKMKADTAAVNTLLFDLANSKLLAYINESPKELKFYNLDPPDKKLEIVLKDKTRLGLNLGGSTRDGGNFFGQRPGEHAVFALEGAVAKKIFRSLHDLKSRKLLDFEMDQVAEIEIQRGGKAFELVKSGDGWDLLKPESIKNMKPFVGKDILWTLNSLNYEQVLESLPKDEAPNWNRPELKIKLLDSKKARLAFIEVGEKINEKALYYARVDGQSKIYQIKARFVDEIPGDLKSFQDKAR